MPASPEQTVEEPPAFFWLGLFRFVVLIHGVSQTWSALSIGA